jgi:hypothetical protein
VSAPELTDLFRQVPVPEDATERTVALARARATQSPARIPPARHRRTLVLIVAGLLAVLAFALTPPGRAAVDWLGGVVQINEVGDGSWGGELRGATVVGRGTAPDDAAYEIRAFWKDGDGTCVNMGWTPESRDSSYAGGGGQAFCNYESFRDSTLDHVGYQRSDNGGTIAFGLASPEVSDVRITYESGGESKDVPSQLFHLSGTVRRDDNTTIPLKPVAYYVAFLPPGVGDAEQHSSAQAVALSDDGQELARAQLAWVIDALGAPDASGDYLLACGSESFWAQTCRDAASGELRRVNPALARPLPAELTRALADRGYAFTPASDEERGLPEFTEEGLSEKVLSPIFTGHFGLHYQRLGRVSGPGLEDRLVYLVHYFSVEDHSGGGGGSTEATSMNDPPDPIDPTATTYLIDAITGERLGTVEYR